MDPISIIVTALATGAAAGLKPTAEKAIKDAYDGIKSLIRRKYSHVSVDALEHDPASQGRQIVMKEDLAKTAAGGDAELLQQAKAVLDAIQKYAPQAAEVVGVRLEDIKGASLKIADIISTGQGVGITGAVILGDIEIKGVRAGKSGELSGASAAAGGQRQEPTAANSKLAMSLQGVTAGRDVHIHVGDEEPVAQASVGEVSRERGAVPVPAGPPTRIVDAMGRGEYVSLVEAVAQSRPGDRLLVRPGFYPGGIVLDKPLEIVGDGDVNEIVIQATGSDVILFKANMGSVRNLTLRQISGRNWYGVDIAEGRLVLEGCDITSQSLSCVAVHDNADPVVRRNRIHDGKSAGIIVHTNGQGTFEENEVFGNAYPGIVVSEGGNPTVRRNRIHDGKLAGIIVHANGQGTFEENEVFGNGQAGIAVKDGGNPTVRRNRIHDGKESGILVYANGQGTFEENEVFGNESAGIEVREGGNPTVRRNRVNNNANPGVWVYDKGKGTFEDNDLRGNSRGSWVIEEGCEVIRAGNQEDTPTT
jgi:parallel beta-helix repeat protein